MDACQRELIEKVAKGCTHSFSQLHHLYYARLLAFSRSILHSHELAEEVVEDVFVRLWVNRETITNIENLVVYLYKATKNRSLTALSAVSRSLVTESFDHIHVELEQRTSPYEILVTAEITERIQEAVNNLPPRCKMVFKLVREDGLRYKEVAEILNISINTIDAQMAIAVERICKALDVPKTLPGKSKRSKNIFH